MTGDAAHAPTLKLARRLTPAQAERRERLREAARALASEGGYGTVTIRAVADRAGVGLATVYRYFSSKDHLLAEVHAAETRKLLEELSTTPLDMATKAERVQHVFDRMLEAVVADLNLAAAGIAAATSVDPTATSPEYWQESIMLPYMETAFGSEDPQRQQELGEILGHLFFSLMIALTSGRIDLDGAKSVMGRAIRLIVGPG